MCHYHQTTFQLGDPAQWRAVMTLICAALGKYVMMILSLLKTRLLYLHIIVLPAKSMDLNIHTIMIIAYPPPQQLTVLRWRSILLRRLVKEDHNWSPIVVLTGAVLFNNLYTYSLFALFKIYLNHSSMDVLEVDMEDVTTTSISASSNVLDVNKPLTIPGTAEVITTIREECMWLYSQHFRS